jgi:hypothetical protein
MSNTAQMSRETPKMSTTTRDILMKVRKMIPPLLEKFHKGAIKTVCLARNLTSTRADGQNSGNRRQ